MKTKTNKHNQNKTNNQEILNRTKQLSTGTETGTGSETETGTKPSEPATPAAPETAQTLNPQPSTLNPTKSIRPYINYAEREYSRKLPASKILEVLRRWMPRAYELAEVVGDWIWITFPEQPAERLRADLAQLGFHWNNSRKCWQHPCGKFMAQGSTQDPRGKYGSSGPVRLGLASAARTADTQPAA